MWGVTRSGYLAELWIGAEIWFVARYPIPKNNQQIADDVELLRSICPTQWKRVTVEGNLMS